MDILGISLGHDSSFSLVSDGKIIEIMEAERYFRRKRYKLQCQNLTPGKQKSGYQYVNLAELEFFISLAAKSWGRDFEYLAVQNQGRYEEFNNLIILLRRAGFNFKSGLSVNHHLAHAALSYYTSPFKEALILSYDGFGNDGYTLLFKASPAGIEYFKHSNVRFGQCYNNLGYIVGIQPDVSGSTAGKLMGLSSYGQMQKSWLPYALRYVRKYRKLIDPRPDEMGEYGKAYRFSSFSLDKIPDLKNFVSKVRQDIPVRLSEKIKHCFCIKLTTGQLRLPGPENKLAQDLAHTLQWAWTQEVIRLLGRHKNTSRNLCLVGGCALNGIANYAIQQSQMFKDIHFVPNPSDCGLSAGAALYVYHKFNTGHFKGYPGYLSPYLGSEPFDINEMSHSVWMSHRTMKASPSKGKIGHSARQNFRRS